MNRPVLTVVSNADEKFFPGLAVAVASAVTAGSGKFDYHFLILDGGLETASLEKLSATIGKIAAAKGFSAKLDALHVDQSRRKFCRTSIPSSISTAMSFVSAAWSQSIRPPTKPIICSPVRGITSA
jgi:lipopolysaccharide biosynthesis glycosyltransferase